MAFRIRKQGTVLAEFASPQAVVIDHANDSIRVGDGVNLMGPLELVGAQLCFPVAVMSVDPASGIATASNQTDGSQKTQIVQGGATAEVDDVGGEKALKVSVIASVGGGGGGTASTDESAFTAGAVDFTPIGGNYDANGSEDLADGEMGMARITAERALHVHIATDGATLATAAKQDTIIGHVDGLEGLLGTGNTSLGLIDDIIFVDDAAFTAATSKVAMIGGQYQSSPNALDDGDAGSLLLDSSHRLVVAVTANALPTGASTLAEQQTQTTALQLIDDVVFVDDAAYTAATHKLLVVGGQYQGTPNALDDGDAGTILLDANHAVQAVLRAGSAAIGKLAANNGVDIGDVDVTSVTCAAANAKVDIGLINAVTPLMGAGNTGTGSLRVTLATDQTTPTNPFHVDGAAAFDAAVAGNPLLAGLTSALTALPATVSALGEVTRMLSDGHGRALNAGAFPPGACAWQTTSITNTTETTIVTAVASEGHDIIAMWLTNNSDVQSIATLRDDTAGTARAVFLIPARGGLVLCPSTPFMQPLANDNWTLQMTTTATATNVSVYFGKRPI